MTTCIDTNLCPVEHRMYHIVCNFSFGIGGYYACNTRNTCVNPNGSKDCCSPRHNIVDCLVWTSYLPTPTIRPSVTVQEVSCINKCDTMEYKIDTCYWYESKQTDNLCIGDNTKYCCSQKRADCCYTNQQNVVIVFGCIVAIITIAVYYFTIREQYKKVMPLQSIPTIVTIDKYAIAL